MKNRWPRLDAPTSKATLKDHTDIKIRYLTHSIYRHASAQAITEEGEKRKKEEKGGRKRKKGGREIKPEDSISFSLRFNNGCAGTVGCIPTVQVQDR